MSDSNINYFTARIIKMLKGISSQDESDEQTNCFLNRGLSILAACIFSLLFTANSSFCLENTTLDTFSFEIGDGELVEGEPFIVEDRNALGGLRGVLLTGGVSGTEAEGLFTFDGSGDATGSIQFLWDGAGESFDPIEYEGLGGQNFTEDDLGSGLDALRLTLNSITTSGSITITLYTDEATSSQYTLSPPTSGVPVSYLIPYTSFTGDADFTNIGSMVIKLSGGLVAEIDQLEATTILAGIKKRDSLQIDNNNNSKVDAGDTVRYTITVPGSAAVHASFNDSPDPNSLLVVGSVTTTQGTVTSGNNGGDTNVTVDMGTLPAGGAVTITFDVTVEDPFVSSDTFICNQGVVSGTGLISAQTDDPDVSVSFPDATCTTVFVDVTDPVFDEPFPADLVINAGDSTDPSDTGTPTATDDVTISPVITYSDATLYGPAPFQTTIQRTWKAEDEAGNSTVRIQSIEIADTADHSLVIDQPVYGLFNPNSSPGNRQLGTIELTGDITLLGTDTSIDPGNISTSSNLTAYNMSDAVFYFIGQTASDSLSKIFTVDLSNGTATAQILSEGTYNTVVGIWFDDVTDTLYGLIDPSASPGDRRLATINPTNGTVSYLAESISAPIFTVGGVVAGSSSQGSFFFLGSTAGIPGAIYTVDTVSGASTSAALSGINYNQVASLEYDEFEGVLYALIFEGTERRLATIDPATGTVTPLGSTTIAGGGVQITTYQGVSTLNPFDNQFLFVGRYDPGTGNVWALFGVDTTTGDTAYNTIDITSVNSGFYYGLQYAINTGSIEIRKAIVPATDSGLFDLQLDGVSQVSNVGDGGTTGEITLQTGDYTVGEVAGSGTYLTYYIPSMECRDSDGAGGIVASGTPPQIVSIGTDDDIVCVITNTLDVGSLEIVKELVPETDPGLFDLLIDGSVEASDVGDGGTTGKMLMHVDSYSVSEAAGLNTVLADYTSNIACRNAGGAGTIVASGPPPVNVNVSANSDILCIVTNILNDSDGDGIDDSWEITYFGNLTTANAVTDYDHDGYSDLQEFINDKNGETDPLGDTYDPTVRNAPGGTGYDSSSFWLLMAPALSNGGAHK